MNIDDALSLARNLKHGPLPKPNDQLPTVDEAIDLIQSERKQCGFNWLTGEAAVQALKELKDHNSNS